MNFNCDIGRRQAKKQNIIYIFIRYFINFIFNAILLTFINLQFSRHSSIIPWWFQHLENAAHFPIYRISLYIHCIYPPTFFFDILTSIATRGYPAIRDDTGAYVADGKRYFSSLRDLWNIFNSLEMTADRSCRSDPFPTTVADDSIARYSSSVTRLCACVQCPRRPITHRILHAIG